MSLVAYESSDDSEEENVSKPTLSKKISDPAIKKQRECVKITIPSLTEFEEEEYPVAPKKPKLQSGSGLFSLLPPPKNTTALSKPGFVPHVLSSKKEPLSLISKKCETKFTKTEAPHTLLPSTVPEEQDSDDEIPYSKEKSSEENLNASTNKDFFSLDDLSSKDKINDDSYLSADHLPSVSSPVECSIFNQSETFKLPSASSTDIHQSLQKESKGNSYFQQYNQLLQADGANYEQQHSLKQAFSVENYSTESVSELDSKESLLKDKEFLKLHGRRHEFEAVDIIDVNADDQLTDRNEWLMKSLTEESTHRPSRKKHNMPTQQQKRKHQITYLAFQAKEREMDLKNQWAMNSRTRRETQAKYGF